jgi:hypothetical protein
MSNQFNTFDTSLTPLLADFIVGYGLIGAVEIEKRWTISELNDLLGTNINITELHRAADNYLTVTGTGAGGGQVTIEPAGADANIDLIINSKGAGTVTFGGSLTIAADLNLGGFDLNTQTGDVNTGGGAINTAGGSVALAAGNLSFTSGSITMTSGDITLSGGDLTLSAGGTLDVAGGQFLTDFIAVSLAGFITISDDVSIGVAAANKALTTSQVTGNKDAPAAGQEPIELVLSGVVECDDEVFIRDKLYLDADVMTKGFLRASQSVGQTADVTSVQGGGLISKEFNQYSTVANIGDCATLPALSPEGYSAVYRYPFTHIVVRNDGANNMDVFPNTGGTINGGAANAAVAVNAGAVAHFYGQEVGGVDTWFTA